MSPGTTLLAATGICKHFGEFTANDDVGFEIEAGEIHALLGENGAGKSTFVKMVYGLLQPDSGQIIWRGEPVTIRSPQHARELGIGMVFQHFSLFQALTVAENIALALAPDVILESDSFEFMQNFLHFEPALFFQIPIAIKSGQAVVGADAADFDERLVSRPVDMADVAAGTLHICHLKGRVLPVAAAKFLDNIITGLRGRYSDEVDQ